MHLAPKDLDKLVLHQAGVVAQKRYARGLRLNYPEAAALLATQLLEFIRDGESVATLMDKGKQLLGFNDVLEGVADLLPEVQVEGTFPDGTKLVTVHQPICREHGAPELALYGSGLARTAPAAAPVPAAVPGEYLLADGDIILNENRALIELEVLNRGDRPVQVGSHYPFFETNAGLDFDRAAAFGYRLHIPAGTAVRFEPGERKRVQLVALAGERRVYGGNGWINGPLDEAGKQQALGKFINEKFKSKPEHPIHNNVVLAIYKNGIVLNLDGSTPTPDSELLVIIFCEFDHSTRGKGDYEYYKYYVISNTLSPVASNSFTWNNYKCTIQERDEYTYPKPDWTRNYGKQMRPIINIEKGSESINIRPYHSGHNGYAFRALMSVLTMSASKTLQESVNELMEYINEPQIQKQ